jgi:hypothetical protein
MLQYWQQLIVFFIVLLAALHACAKYLPVSWRQRVVYLLSRRGAASSKMAAWLAVRVADGLGCGGGCSSCKLAQPCHAEVEPEPAPRRVIRLHLQPHAEPDITPHR